MALAVVTVGALHRALPDGFTLAPMWVFQALLLIFLAVLIIGDPGRVDRERPWLRVTTELMIGLIAVTNAVAVGRLVIGILENATFSAAPDLLRVGGVVWVTNVLTFALWFWDLDAGGAAARANGSPNHPVGFIFPEYTNPELVEPGWFPRFVDYLALSFNTAMAFSPTDVAAVRPWAKLLLMAESMVSLLVAVLVLARAINILPT
jgi:hypothetical protein